ncbi:MAG: hypothetical protein WBA13_02680 [Microcoleaceae cyanobacterium]
MSELPPLSKEICHKILGVEYTNLISSDSSWVEVFQNKTSPQENINNSCFEEILESSKVIITQEWSNIFRDTFADLEYKEYFIRLIGCLKKHKHPIEIHRLEKDLIYLISLAIQQKKQLIFSFPVSSVALGILSIAFYASLPRELRVNPANQSSFKKRNFIIWVRPQNNGQILTLRTTQAFNLKDYQYSYCQISDQLTCLPIYNFEESVNSNKTRVVMVRSLSEATELLKKSQYCSFVVLDDPSGCTHRSPYQYGNKTFKLTNLCHQKQIPLIGIIPPWTMKHIEFQENKNHLGILLWPIDFFALYSYPKEKRLLAGSTQNIHPIEESCSIIERKRQSLREAQVNIMTFNFETEDEERIAELFQESSELLLELAQQPKLRKIWGIGWEIWRHLAAPILPFYLLWEKFIENGMKRLQLATQKSKIAQAQSLYDILYSLIFRLQKIKINPFISRIESAVLHTVVAVHNAHQATALEQFLKEKKCLVSSIQILPMSQIRDLGGDKLIIIGQPKARYRDILQTTFFSEIDVLLWSVLAKRAERWWSNLEVDAREWHRKTWSILTEDKPIGCYGFSPHYSNVKIIHQGTVQVSKKISLFQLEERFNRLSGDSLNSALSSSAYQDLEEYYEVEFKEGWKIRVPSNSEFLMLLRKQTHLVIVNELVAETRVVLFDGMNREELFAEKAGLLDDTKVNYFYRIKLDVWREFVKQKVKQVGLEKLCRYIASETGYSIGKETVQYYWMNGNDLLSLPQKKEHFFWFIPPLSRSDFEEFWQTANNLRNKRRQLGQVISACAQEGWTDKESEEVIFRHHQVSITVGELREAMQFLIIKSSPKLIRHPPILPVNRLYRDHL